MVRRPALAFAAGAVALWSTNALVGRYLLAEHPLSLIQFLQFAGAACVFLLIRLKSGAGQPMTGRDAPLLMGIGLIGLVGTMVLQYIAFASMPVVEANLIAYTWPLMVAAMVIVSGATRRPMLLAATAGIGFFGVALVITGGRDETLLQGNPAGYAAALGSALCMALYTQAIGRFAASAERPLLPSALIGCAGTLIWCLRDGVAWHAGFDLLLGFYLGAGPMGLGYYFWSRAMQDDRSGKIALAGYLTPVASTLLLSLAGERLTAAAALGGLLVIASCLALGLERQSEREEEVARHV
jgi:drug/metabolite transporter (DMT)-like permease